MCALCIASTPDAEPSEEQARLYFHNLHRLGVPCRDSLPENDELLSVDHHLAYLVPVYRYRRNRYSQCYHTIQVQVSGLSTV